MDVTSQVLASGQTTGTQASLAANDPPGTTSGQSAAALSGSDPATGSVSATQNADIKTQTVQPQTTAQPTSLVDRITLDETRESDADNRLTVLETNVKALGESLNGLTDAFNAYTAKAGLNAGDGSAVSTRLDRIAERIFGAGSGL